MSQFRWIQQLNLDEYMHSIKGNIFANIMIVERRCNKSFLTDFVHKCTVNVLLTEGGILNF